MAARGEEFVGLVPPKEKQPQSNALAGRAGISNIFRDQFTIMTWLCFGAVVQSLLLLIAGRMGLVPALVVILYKAVNTYAATVGWNSDKYMDGVIKRKFSAQFPNERGQYGCKPADSDVVVFLLGTRCNHPLGMLAPGYRDLSRYFREMVNNLDEQATDFGFLGMTSWMNISDRTTGSELMQVSYFRTIEGLHNFAHSPCHRKGWDWWNRHVKNHPHLSIFHETYQVPKSHWECVYLNSNVSGLASTTHKFTDEKTGREMWASPIVDASKGLLKTSAGRMSRSKADEHDQYGEDPYQ